MISIDARKLYTLMRNRFGFLNWWPGETDFEVVVGAILTQQTTWSNVEKAIHNLKRSGNLKLEKICAMKRRELEDLIRSSGYFRQKSERLQNFCIFVKENYSSIGKLFSLNKEELREVLLSQKGIGKETCDSIMLYAAGKPIFVIDAYTKRIVGRVLGIRRELQYDELQSAFENSIARDIDLYKDMHAQFVELGKQYCKNRKPLCTDCPLLQTCSYGSSG